MKNKHRAWAAVAAALVGWSGSAASAVADVSTANLALHESAGLPGGATLTLDELSDSRCRVAERCSPSQAASREAVASVTLRMADGRRYAGTIAIGGVKGRPSAAHPAHAKVGDQLVELVGIAPEGRELPSDGPGGRPQRATLRITPSDRVAVTVGTAVDLKRAGFTLRVLAIDDQRCPIDVACGVAGYVKVDVELSASDATSRRLTFGSPEAPKESTWRGHEIELCDVLPRRASLAKGTSSGPQQAEFFVSRSRAPAGSSVASAGRLCTPPTP